MKKSFIIVIVSLIVLIGLFIFLRPSDTIKLPVIDKDNSNVSNAALDAARGITGVKKISDAKKGISGSDSNGTIRPKSTPKPLPYPRISINYSIQRSSSIGGNSVDKNSTFVIVMLDIRNYGYKYFDAFSNNFRGVLTRNKEEIRPLVNISTGNMIDAVIPNSSRAKGDLLFLTSKKISIRDIIYHSNESYYIIYKKVSPSQIEDKKKEDVSDRHDEDDE